MNSSAPKQYLELAGKPIIVRTLLPFRRCEFINQIIVVVPSGRIEETAALIVAHFGAEPDIGVVAGGVRRQDSVRAGLDAVHPEVEIVIVHDGVRPLVSERLIEDCYEQAVLNGAAIAAVPVKDTLKRASAELTISATVDRDGLWQAQTPQAMRKDMLRQGFAQAGRTDVTDEAGLLEMAGFEVELVPGDETNIKITRPDDLELARTLMAADKSLPRIGHGFDAHRFSEGRTLVLGGVDIDHPLGLAGHSDADVVTHALCDAILGALGAGDIGRHFPDSDESYRGISSLVLLDRVIETAREHGMAFSNCDITVVCQTPRLSPHVEAMRQTLARHCGCSAECVNVKATTTEKMGFTGRQEGISCHAVVLLQPDS